MLRLLREVPVAHVTWVVLSGSATRRAEALRAARAILGRRVQRRIIQAEFRESYFPYTAVEIKEFFDELGSGTRPDIVFTHYREDRHQDHRLVSELTYNTFRDHLVLEYEIFKTDGDLGNPNVYVALDDRTLRRKIDVIQRSFVSQRRKRWFSDEAFRALAQLRGIEAGGVSGLAEAFYGRKILL
jgi:LmbE family N-acetylglucosaminyl deacetylase